MSTLIPAPKVKPFAAIFASSEDFLVKGLMCMSSIIGCQPDIVSPGFPVNETAYYQKEMGSSLIKIYASWPKLMPPENLVQAKLATMECEKAHSVAGRRLINIDPGYIFSGGLVLSTGKFRGHRLPLGHCVWGELTLNFHQGKFMSFPWTYLDYQNEQVQEWLLKMRQSCMDQLRIEGGA